MAKAPEPSGAKVVGWMLLGLLVLFGGGYAAAGLAAGDRLPRGTEVAGVEVGGLTPAAARDKLATDWPDDEVDVNVGARQLSVRPDAVGLSLDVDRSIAQAEGAFGWDPGRLWDYYTGGDDFDPVAQVDRTRMDRWLDAIGESVLEPAVDGAVRFRDGQVQTTDPADGQGLDTAAARDALLTAYTTGVATDLPMQRVQPDVGERAVRRAVRTFANPAMSGPVELKLGEERVRLTPQQYDAALTLRPRGDRLVPHVRRGVLLQAVGSPVSTTGSPVDASFKIVHGKPVVVPAKPGVTFEPRQVVRAFVKAVARPEGSRSVRVKPTPAKAAFTTKDARKLGIKERISTFSTSFPYAEYRNINLPRAASLIDGTILEPGETFSLNGTVGERTKQNGFAKGFIIEDGVYKEDYGGGVSQIATTTFNAMYFAGLKDIEHKPHSFYIDRYPIGREATVAWGSVDLRFQNDTKYGVLITAHVDKATPSRPGTATVSMWSTKVWDITSANGPRYNPTEPKTRVLHTKDCTPNEGYGGFDIDVTRIFRHVGSSKVDHREVFHTTYTPSDTVVCK